MVHNLWCWSAIESVMNMSYSTIQKQNLHIAFVIGNLNKDRHPHPNLAKIWIVVE